jgi:hypothetical protein
VQGTKFLKPILIGAIVLAVVAAGGSWLISTVRGNGPAVDIIGEGTELSIERWCLVCGDYRPVENTTPWQGMDMDALNLTLAKDLPGAKILAFSKEQVVVHLPPGYCDKCMTFMPLQGYIGLSPDNKLAVFSQDGTLVKEFGEAPGAWTAELSEGIPFSSPQECLDLLVNLTS